MRNNKLNRYHKIKYIKIIHNREILLYPFLNLTFYFSGDRDFGNRTLIKLKINLNVNYSYFTILSITTIFTSSLKILVNLIRYKIIKINANKSTDSLLTIIFNRRRKRILTINK